MLTSGVPTLVGKECVAMRCPYCEKWSHIIKSGVRKTKKGSVQKYRCMECGRSFCDSVDPYSKYPLKVVLHSLELYNLGHPASNIKKMIGRKYHLSPPTSTIYSWSDRFEKELTFIKQRKKMKLDPGNIIHIKNFQHRQIVPFAYHMPKVNIQSKTFPGIKRYIDWINRSLPDRMFLEGPRMSTYKMAINHEIKPVSNILPRLTKLALERSSDTSPHNSVESFFLINDSSTVATEIPVFLNPSEIEKISTNVPITGHIDMLQARFGKIYILDYKPNLKHPENYSSQLHLYREAIGRRMNIPKNKISIMAFNEHSAFEYR